MKIRTCTCIIAAIILTQTATRTTTTSKWVKNMSSTPLTEAQEQLLVHGPNFTISPKCPPIGKYITVVEQTCLGLAWGEAEELHAEVKAVIRKIHPLGLT